MIGTPRKSELELDPISEIQIGEITPTPENDEIYGVINIDDPEILELAKSIVANGLLEPMVISRDGYIISGHRRYWACKRARLKVIPCRVADVFRCDDIDTFVLLLREHNRQRDKSLDVKLREEIINADSTESHRALSEYRVKARQVDAKPFEIRGEKRRAAISKAKQPFLNAVLHVLTLLDDFWPVTVRTVHYQLLNDPPLRHASKPASVYENSRSAYKSLVDICARGRVAGLIPWEAIIDETRPVSKWNVHSCPRAFIRKQNDKYLKSYWRNLMQSQPNHIEIVGEKNTIGSIINPVGADFTIPVTLGRGFCSLPPRRDMSERYWKSGKSRLVLLLLSDFDPDGMEIAHSFARSMRDDFGVCDIHPVRVALTAEQVVEHQLPTKMAAKPTSVNYKKFLRQNGGNDAAFELEALPPRMLQKILTEAIESVIDIDLYNAEVAAEEKDAAFLDGVRSTVHDALKRMKWEQAE